jgi:uncharacterized protein involved in type VI secretion and phage assembly
MNTIATATIGGKPHGLQFHSASVRQSIFSPCEISLVLGFEKAENDSVFDQAVSSWLGKEIVLTFSDKDDSSIQKKYEGTIRHLSMESQWLLVKAFSEDYALTLAEKHRSFADREVFSVVSDVINKSGIKAKKTIAPDKSVQFRFLHQYDETDYDFLKRLARYDGCVFYHDGESFVYVPKLSGSQTVQLGLDRITNVRLRCSLGDTKFHGVPYDYLKHSESSNLKFDSAKAQPSGHPFLSKVYQKSDDLQMDPIEIFKEPFPVKKEFEQFVKNQQSFNGGMYVMVEGQTTHPNVAIGRAVACKDDPILKNSFVIIGLEAEYRNNGYHATFRGAVKDTVTRSLKIDEREYMGLLQPAIVIDNIDPEKLGRVQIKYLWDVDSNAHAWARVVNMGAGKNHGSHFTPRLGDQVLVGCEHGNSSLPIVLGALYHSENKPDCKTDNGSEEVLLTKTPAGSEIRVTDKQGSEEILLSMPQSKNIIRMELKGPKITVESVGGTIVVHSKTIQINADEKIQVTAKDIEITAQNNITQKVGKDLSVTVGGKSEEKVSQDKKTSAGANVSVEAGSQTEISAGAAVKIKSTQVESSAAATNTIKGAIVQIN